MLGTGPTPLWLITSKHPDFPGSAVDFAELAHGTNDEPPNPKGANMWLGGFRGRPGLIGDLMPVIEATYSLRTPTAIKNLLATLRVFWRFLDAYEDWLKAKGQTLHSALRLHDISGVHLEHFSQPGPDDRWTAVVDSRARLLRALILDAVHQFELPHVQFAALNSPRLSSVKRKDTPSQEEGLLIIRHLRAEVSAIFRRWSVADQMAKEGRDLFPLIQHSNGKLPPKFHATEADAHATYRALIQRIGHPLPTAQEFRYLMPRGSNLRSWWPRYDSARKFPNRSEGDSVSWADCIAGLYPTSADIATCALLCLGRSAWNPATLLSIDVNNWWSTYDDDHAWIFSRKDRAGGALQHTISSKNHASGTYQIIRRLSERNAALRSWLSQQEDSSSLQLALRSPWIGTSRASKNLIFVPAPQDTSTLNNWLKAHIETLNRQSATTVQVREMSSSDFRDIAAATMYRDSRYSMWVLMLMLGHKNVATTRSYGYRHANRQESHRLVATVVGDALGQISSTRRWDPVLTRARVENITVAPEALERLREYRDNRTYSGAVCSDPFNPPNDIDPNHPNDGKSRCVQGHLCVARACPRSVVLNDSLTDICKTVAELEWRRTHTGMVRFSVGSEERDLLYLRSTLEQWPAQDVEDQLALWRERLSRGEHQPLIFAGQH